MILQSLKLNNFRNYQELKIDWDPQINLIYGLNAQGKSNLLEAVCYLGLATSFRGAAETDLIHWGEDYFYLEGRILRQREGRLHLSAAANRHRQRRWKVDEEAKGRLSDVVGLFHTVIFAPEDVLLIRSGPDSRRRYLNQQMSQLDREYCRTLISYNRVLRQRTAFLKQWDLSADVLRRQQQQEQLAVWDQQLVELGALIAVKRQLSVDKLTAIAQDLHQGLAASEQLGLRYINSFAPKERVTDLEEAKELFSRELARIARSEQMRGMSLSGPHRDELAITINGKPARDFASQGQQRTAALSLKLAELELAQQLRGEYPVLLLDDVLSELDQQRRKEILTLAVGKTQTFITAVDGDLPRVSAKKWRIENGAII